LATLPQLTGTSLNGVDPVAPRITPGASAASGSLTRLTKARPGSTPSFVRILGGATRRFAQRAAGHFNRFDEPIRQSLDERLPAR
jgi:hypothetical protein